ncbi:hypothetical protein GGD61_001715 [Bradyrhizobium sp. SBR1B]|nr:hypothetical protein [Bradyrhizobium sp. SBR1B]
MLLQNPDDLLLYSVCFCQSLKSACSGYLASVRGRQNRHTMGFG